MNSDKIISKKFRHKAAEILHEYIKCDLHYFLKSKEYLICEMKNKRYCRNYGHIFTCEMKNIKYNENFGHLFSRDKLLIYNNLEDLWFSKSDIVKYSKPLKYKSKNRYIKGYNKN